MREEKKKKRKRILSVVLAVTMGMSMLTGYGRVDLCSVCRIYAI